MANLGFYSRHLTDDDVQGISASTRKLIFSNSQIGVDDKIVDEYGMITAENILNRLLLCGNYENIIKNIFKYLNATQLACLQKTCASWFDFIHQQIWNDERTCQQIRSYWGSYMPKCFVITHNRTIISMKCTPEWLICGVEKNGQVVIYNRAKLFEPKNLSEAEEDGKCPVMPHDRIQVTKDGASVTTVDMDNDIMVTGTSDGCVQLYDLATGHKVASLSQSASMVYQVRIVNNRILITMGTKVTVHRLTDSEGVLATKLTHLLTGHSRDVLCVDMEDDIVVSGGMDTNVLVYRLGPDNVFKLVHTLSGHKLKVRCISMSGQFVVSGSWDRTAMLWDITSGACVRVLKHEIQVRCVTMDSRRILTGDIEGYVYAWDVENCVDQAAGPEKLCLRAHNAMDPDVYCKSDEKIVYSVHLEPAAMVQVAGGTGRIVVSDFWDYDAFDVFQLESYVHDTII